MSNLFPIVELYSSDSNPEGMMAHVARVSNPKNQDNPNIVGLLSYCVTEGHWSVFEHSHMTVKITTTLDIATQILRHRSFTFQQLSRRYAGDAQAPVVIHLPELRAPHPKNRQKSIDSLSSHVKERYSEIIANHFKQAELLYKELLVAGVAKECARSVLPQATETVIYMTGNCRSFMHYIAVRGGLGTQPEHMAVADKMKRVFKLVYPNVFDCCEALNWQLYPRSKNN